MNMNVIVRTKFGFSASSAFLLAACPKLLIFFRFSSTADQVQKQPRNQAKDTKQNT
jgi:hypothetical protein